MLVTLTGRDSARPTILVCLLRMLRVRMTGDCESKGATGAAGKILQNPPHNRGKSIVLPRYCFSRPTISVLLSYTKIVKISAVRSVFATKNSPKCFCGAPDPMGEFTQTPSASQFSASLCPKSITYICPQLPVDGEVANLLATSRSNGIWEMIQWTFLVPPCYGRVADLSFMLRTCCGLAMGKSPTYYGLAMGKLV